MNLFLAGCLVAILILLIAVIFYWVIFINIRYRNKKYFNYYLSITALKLDIIRGEPIRMVKGFIYTNKKIMNQPINEAEMWADDIFIGTYSEDHETAHCFDEIKCFYGK
jgi:hypothetical protein